MLRVVQVGVRVFVLPSESRGKTHSFPNGVFFSVFVVNPDWPLPRVFEMISVTVSLQKLLIIKPLCSHHIIKFLDWFNLIWLLQEICPLHVEWWTYTSNQSWKACLRMRMNLTLIW